jgi:polar amino acid transport system substrate-binding protein
VTVSSESAIATLSDLEGKRVAVMSSTKPESLFLEQADDQIPDVKEVYCFENMELAFAALQAGYVDAVAGHEPVICQYMETAAGEYRLLDEELLSVDVGIAFLKDGDGKLEETLEAVLSDMEEDGTLEFILSSYGISMQDIHGGDGQ